MAGDYSAFHAASAMCPILAAWLKCRRINYNDYLLLGVSQNLWAGVWFVRIGSRNPSLSLCAFVKHTDFLGSAIVEMNAPWFSLECVFVVEFILSWTHLKCLAFDNGRYKATSSAFGNQISCWFFNARSVSFLHWIILQVKFVSLPGRHLYVVGWR